MMAESVAKDDFWLPDELQLAYDLLLEEASAASSAAENRKRAMEPDGDDEELIATLSRRLAMSFPHKEKVMAYSPQSTLFGPGRSSSLSSNNCSPEGPSSQVSSPLSTPLEQQQRGSDDDLELLYAAAGRVVRLGLDEDRGPRKPDPHHFKPNPVLIQQQLQAAHFYQMRREQLLKQQLAAAWRSAGAGRRMDLSPSAWPALQKPRQQPPTVPGSGSGMRAVFINGSGARRGSAGTGVFLPRHAGSRVEPKKKPTCSTTVLLPARVVQALNLELDGMGVPKRGTGAYFDQEDMFVSRSNITQQQQQQLRSNGGFSKPASSVTSSSHEHHLLPQEWTY